MGFASGGFFGGGTKTSSSKAYTTTTTKTMDQRLGIEGGVGGGQVIGPESSVATGPGVAARTGDYSPLTQWVTGNKYKVGLTGMEVQGLLQQQSAGFVAAADMSAASNAKLAQLATTALSAQQGMPVDWGKYIVPIGVIIGIVMVVRSRKRGR